MRKLRLGVLVLNLSAALAVGSATTGCGKTVGQTIDDATITARVKTALLNDPQVSGLKIDVDTALGVVTMSGVVKNPDEEQRAVSVARSVNGVREVRSTLQVNP